MRKCFSALAACLLAAHILPAQTVIQGAVHDENGAVIPGAVVSLRQQDKLLRYGTTDRQGRYRLETGSTGGAATVSFDHLSYEKLEVPVTLQSRQLDVILRERSEKLREVTVTAPVVKLRGDTLSFWLPGLAAQEDYTLEDAMKRIPGIEVAASGRISYQGRAISHFYIDGVDVLGGKYSLATRGIPAKMVDEVEVLDNHQSIKMERKTGRTNQVALNIKLNKEARLKPVGTSEARAGWGADGALWRLGGSLMTLGGQNQAILSAKAGNDAQFALNETSNFFVSDRISGHAAALTGSLSASSPPVGGRWYIRPLDGYFSVDASRKQSEDVQLKLNAHYAYSHSAYAYGTQSDYYAGDERVTVREHFAPASTLHIPTLSLEYRLNADDRYVDETFRATANFVSNALDTERDAAQLSQQAGARLIRLQNRLDWRQRVGQRRISFSNETGWTAVPTASYTFSGTGYQGRQSGRSHHLSTIQTARTSRDWRFTTLELPLRASLDYDRLDTSLETADLTAEGRLGAWTGYLGVSPSLRWQSRSRRFQVDAALDLGARGLFVHENKTCLRQRRLLGIADPTLSLDWQASARSEWRLSVRSNRIAGDFTDFLLTPTLSGYRSIRKRPGILRDGRNSAVSLTYDWKRPIELWFAHADATASRTASNLRSAQTVEGERIWTTSLPEPVRSDALNLSGTLSKRFQRTSTKLSVGARGGWSRNAITQQGRAIDYDGRNLRLDWEASTAPWRWISLSYQGDWSRDVSAYLGGSSSFVSQTHTGSLSLFPVTGLRLHAEAEFVRTQIAADSHKQMLLGEAGIEWSKGKVRAGLQVHNLFDTRSYAYALFTGLDTFSYDFALRGREFLFTFTYTL